MDTDYTQTANMKILSQSNFPNGKAVQYMCVNTFWGIGRNEYVWYKLGKTEWDALVAAGTSFDNILSTTLTDLKNAYPSWEFIQGASSTDFTLTPHDSKCVYD